MYRLGLIYVQLASLHASLCFRCFFSKLVFREDSRIHSLVLRVQYFSLPFYNSVAKFQIPFSFAHFLLEDAPMCSLPNVEGSYALHDQHFICCCCRDRWIDVLDRENARARVIRGKLEVKCPVCRKACILRKGRRSSSVDLFFGSSIR